MFQNANSLLSLVDLCGRNVGLSYKQTTFEVFLKSLPNQYIFPMWQDRNDSPISV